MPPHEGDRDRRAVRGPGRVLISDVAIDERIVRYDCVVNHGRREPYEWGPVRPRSRRPKLHDLSQCDGGTPIQGWVEQLFGMGIQTRCHYNAVSDPSVHAIVTVYSSGRDVDKGAALDRGKAHEASYP